MASSGLPKTTSGPIQPLSRNPSRAQSFQRTASNRRVYFSEIPPKHQSRWDSGEDKKEHRGCGLCCAWTSLIVGCIILVLLLLGALFLAFLQGALPEFRIKRLNINRLDVVTSKDQQTLLNADVQLLINATNKNDRYELSYGPMKVAVSSEAIDLGTVDVSAYKQSPHKVWELNLQTGVKKSAVNEEDANALKSNFKSREVVITVIFKGSISFDFEGRKVNGLPLTVLCQDIGQSEIDNGLQPKCRVKMFSFF